MPPQIFNPATAYMVAGFLYVVMPLAAWFVMGKGRTLAASVWCLGSMLLGVATFLLVFRSGWPGWLAYGVLNAALYAGNLMHVMALRQELGKPVGWRWAFVVCVVFLLVQEFLRLYADSAILRFGWVLLSLGFLLGLTGWLAWQLHLKEGSQSMRWLARVYALGALAFLIRLSMVVSGTTAPQPMSLSWDSVLTTFSIFIMAVFGSVAILGLYLERSTRRYVNHEVALRSQQTSQLLGQQIADIDRQRSMGELAGAMAHELAQPLTAVATECGLLQRELAQTQHPAMATAHSIARHVDRTIKILEGIRHFIRPAQPDFKPVNLLVVVQDVLQLWAAAGQRHGVNIAVRTDVIAPWVNGDAVQLSQVLFNVLRNAAQAQVPGRAVNIGIHVKQVGESFHLVVEDDGPGFAAHVLAHSDVTFVTTKNDGMGIGLSISRRIAVQHGGALLLGNREGTAGARVVLALPTLMVSKGENSQ